jgi:hypothetical protein
MNILLFILQLFPLLLTTIQQIEAVVQVAKAGPAKLQLVTNVVKNAYKADTSNTLAVTQEQMVPLVQAMTGDIVTFYNATGVFKKSS